MINYILIITGFVQIAIGVCWWMQTHKFERVVSSKEYVTVDLNGNTIAENIGPVFYNKYKIV